MLASPRCCETASEPNDAIVVSALNRTARGVLVTATRSENASTRQRMTTWIAPLTPRPSSSGSTMTLAKFRLRPSSTAVAAVRRTASPSGASTSRMSRGRRSTKARSAVITASTSQDASWKAPTTASPAWMMMIGVPVASGATLSTARAKASILALSVSGAAGRTSTRALPSGLSQCARKLSGRSARVTGPAASAWRRRSSRAGKVPVSRRSSSASAASDGRASAKRSSAWASRAAPGLGPAALAASALAVRRASAARRPAPSSGSAA